ncbi:MULTISPECIES: CNNM domain-containing protein [Corallincola]|uniref:HlyC/CorC family transporter n=3 Tax=Corallincola TaxID=1775176 RepID=A0A368NHH2_9GAMM|nr:MULTISPECIES: hemolysin family protein [Corallincola]RCU49570.1 HlyC/CorC family transporter [Corallincola holothuriorum]TAA47867.1 HlyC/CorC family transporter [Corallincola spongiicola]TCI01983.1 HlyC/CorC family transporter [Corallincola luteus]
MTLLLIYLFVAIGVSFICSVLEAVLLSITPSYVESACQADQTKGKALSRVKDNIEHSISSILILNTFAHTMGAAGVGAQAVQLFGAKWESLIAVLLTLAILYLSEIIPKTLGATHWRSLAYPSARLISFLVKLVFPLVWLSSYITGLFSKDQQDRISREEIQAFTTLGYKGGAIAKQESLLLENILGLRECTTQQILTPRTVVHAFNQQSSVTDALNEELTQRFTRFPVYEESIDHVIGIVNHRAMSEQARHGKGDTILAELAQPIHRVSEQLPVLQLLDLFISRKEHLFLVEDQYGQTAGIVTLEDVIETLLGREIVDETDITEDMQQLAKSRFRDRLRRKSKIVHDD